MKKDQMQTRTSYVAINVSKRLPGHVIVCRVRMFYSLYFVLGYLSESGEPVILALSRKISPQRIISITYPALSFSLNEQSYLSTYHTRHTSALLLIQGRAVHFFNVRRSIEYSNDFVQ